MIRFNAMYALRLIAGASLLLPVIAPTGDRDPVIFPDNYGYTWTNQCATNYLDISATGTVLPLIASGVDSAKDEGIAIMPLSTPFEFYGQVRSEIYISSNGYIAMGNDDGGDFSNDCTLPAIPGNPNASPARIYALHDDLDGLINDGTLSTQFFASCPRLAEALGDQACTVIQWNNWSKHNTSDVIDFEVILYHTSYQIVVQYNLSNGGSEASIGLQNASARSAANFSCNSSNSIPSASSVCFYDPRSPPSGDNNLIFANSFESN